MQKMRRNFHVALALQRAAFLGTGRGRQSAVSNNFVGSQGFLRLVACLPALRLSRMFPSNGRMSGFQYVCTQLVSVSSLYIGRTCGRSPLRARSCGQRWHRLCKQQSSRSIGPYPSPSVKHPLRAVVWGRIRAHCPGEHHCRRERWRPNVLGNRGRKPLCPRVPRRHNECFESWFFRVPRGEILVCASVVGPRAHRCALCLSV